jgi:hypothetical protein
MYCTDYIQLALLQFILLLCVCITLAFPYDQSLYALRYSALYCIPHMYVKF